MAATFRSLTSDMATELRPNKIIEGRKSHFTIQDMIASGMDTLFSGTSDSNPNEEGDGMASEDTTNEGIIERITTEDIGIEDM